MFGAKVMAKILNLYQIDNGVEKKKMQFSSNKVQTPNMSPILFHGFKSLN